MIGKLQIQPFWPALAIPRIRWIRAAVALLVAAAIAGGAVIATRSTASAAYVTQSVVQQDLTQTVTASGTVNPQNTVNVGTQVSGTIQSIYVDYNSKVKKGQVLARLDTSQLQAQLQQAQAALAQTQAQAASQAQNAGGAQAQVTVAQENSAAQQANAQAAQAGIAAAQANLAKAQSAAQVAQQTVSRDRSLLGQGYVAQSTVDSDQSNAVSAQSAVTAAQAALQQARAQAGASVSQAQAAVAQSQVNAAQAGASADTAQAAQASIAAAQAQVQQDELNLQHAVITSPIDGTIVARDVSVGQTVAASLQTPTLFSIAQDLKKMEVDINVGEPDIGNVRPGDAVTFSVLAYPNQTFAGKVVQVRVNPATVNNVVTYTVITDVDNKGGKLLPGMTANATIGVQTAKNAFVVPLQALSFRPSFGGKRGSHARSAAPSGAASPWGATSATASSTVTAGSNGLIFVQTNGKPHPVRVRIALISGTQAAVTPANGSQLSAGDSVIVAMQSPQSGSGTSRSQASRPGTNGGPGGMGGLGRAMR